VGLKDALCIEEKCNRAYQNLGCPGIRITYCLEKFNSAGYVSDNHAERRSR
jgi:hypothetical protein